MKVKKEYVLLVLIILALSTYLYLRSTDRTLYEIPEVPDIAGEDITEIDIIKPGGVTILLSKKDDKWFIKPQGFPADMETVDLMLPFLKEVTLTALVSEAKDYNRYDLGDDQKITVKVRTGDKLQRHLDVGKAAPSYRHTFVRLAGDKNVYHAKGNFRGNFDETIDTLRDKTILSFDKKEIREIQITKGDKTLTLKRKEVSDSADSNQKSDEAKKSVWLTPDDNEGDGSKVGSLLKTLADLECRKYIEGHKKEDLKDPIYMVRLTGDKEYTLSIFAKDSKDVKNYPSVSSQSNYPFELEGNEADKIMIDPGDMVKKPEPNKN